VDTIRSLSDDRDELGERRSGDAVLRTYGIGAQILQDLGIQRMRVLSAPKQLYGISGFGLEITGYVER
jgi:3,4-dihydroxy 2-butanone 4-phosphate synthase/GTP cyclohydrolase II